MTSAASPSDTDPRSDAMSGLLARNWWAVALRGVCAVLFGAIALITPGVALLSLVLVFGAYMLVDGIFAIVSAVRAARSHDRWGLLLLQGLTDLVAAAISFLLPIATVFAFVYLMAAWALVSGGLALGAAFRLRRDHGRWWLGLSGVLSIVAGVLLALAPLAGAVVLTWWIAAYSIVYGAILLALAFRLRSHRPATPHGATPHPA